MFPGHSTLCSCYCAIPRAEGSAVQHPQAWHSPCLQSCLQRAEAGEWPQLEWPIRRGGAVFPRLLGVLSESRGPSCPPSF